MRWALCWYAGPLALFTVLKMSSIQNSTIHVNVLSKGECANLLKKLKVKSSSWHLTHKGRVIYHCTGQKIDNGLGIGYGGILDQIWVLDWGVSKLMKIDVDILVMILPGCLVILLRYWNNADDWMTYLGNLCIEVNEYWKSTAVT